MDCLFSLKILKLVLQGGNFFVLRLNRLALIQVLLLKPLNHLLVLIDYILLGKALGDLQRTVRGNSELRLRMRLLLHLLLLLLSVRALIRGRN